MNTLKITANANFYHTESDELRNAVSTGNTALLKNTSNRLLQTNSDKNALSGNLTFKHKFNKSRRTLSFTADWNTLNNRGKTFLKSHNQAYFDGITSGSQDLDQMKDYNQSTKNFPQKLSIRNHLVKNILWNWATSLLIIMALTIS